MKRASLLVGLAAALGLVALYASVLTLVSGWAFTRAQAARDWPFLLAIVPLFGTQVALYHALRSGAGAAAASGGMSGSAMVACCAHFLPTLLPYTGIAAFATVVTAWRLPMLLLAVAANLVGIAIALRALRTNRRHEAMRPLHEHAPDGHGAPRGPP